MIKPLLKTWGGKYYLKRYIIDNFPSNYINLDYGEICVGGGSVLLNKEMSTLETIADINPSLIILWLIVQQEPITLQNILMSLDYSEDVFKMYSHYTPRNELEIAIKEYVLSRMSRAGLKKDFAWSNRLRGNKPGDINAWENSIRNISNISQRIQGVRIKCQDLNASLIETYDNPASFQYIDPPYLHSTRVTKSAYEYELEEPQHIDYLTIAKNHKGKILISGYDSSLYNNILGDWNKISTNIVNHSGQTKTKSQRTEILWKNY